MEEEFKLISRIKIDFLESKAYLVQNGENIEQKDQKSIYSQKEFDTKYKIENHSNIKVRVFEDNTFKSNNPILDKIDLYEQYISTISFYKFNIRYWKKYQNKLTGKIGESSTIMLTHETLIEQLEDSVKSKIESKSTKNVKKKLSHFNKIYSLKKNLNIKNFQNSLPVKKDENSFDDGSINIRELENGNNNSFTSEEDNEEINDTSSNFENDSSDINNSKINNKNNKKLIKEKDEENSILDSNVKDDTKNENIDENIKKIGTYFKLKKRPSILYDENAKKSCYSNANFKSINE